MDLRISRRAVAAVALALLAGSAAPIAAREAVRTVAVSADRNPIFAAADPHLTVVGRYWWLYATTPAIIGEKGEPRLYAWGSEDLRKWVRTGPIFDFEGVDWIDDDGRKTHYLWAPALAQANGKSYLYYSVGPQNPTPSRLGVAVADRPNGPFVDSGKPLFTGDRSFEAIDPMVFTDPKSGTAYMYAGGSAGAKLRVWELEPSMVAIRREVPIDQPANFTEGPFMHEREGTYYLSYSSGRWYDHTYRAHYATAPSPVGPWTYRGVILESDKTHKGPGHHSIAQNPSTKEWVIAYHRWETKRLGPYQGDRMIAIQRLNYNADGTIQPVVMDDAPPPASAIAAPAPAPAPVR